MTWYVGRDDGGIYVEEGSARPGEVPFKCKVAAIEYGIACEKDLRDRASRSIKSLQEQLRKAKRR